MRYAIVALILSANSALAAPLVCEPIPDGAGGGRFLEEVAKVMRGGAIEFFITGEDRCVEDWSPERYSRGEFQSGVVIAPSIEALDEH